jgi:hypothetical protein
MIKKMLSKIFWAVMIILCALTAGEFMFSEGFFWGLLVAALLVAIGLQENKK